MLADKSKKDYRGYLRTIIGTPGTALAVVFAIAAVLMTVHEYWVQRQTNWTETKARLIDIQLSERIRKKEKEIFLKVVFEYNVNNKKYLAYSEEIILNESQYETKAKELKEKKNQVLVYYQNDNPTEATFEIQETRPENNMLYVLIPSIILIGVVGFWGLKIRYEHYFKTEN